MIKKILLTLTVLFICIRPVLATRIPAQDSSIYVNDYAEVLNESTKQTLISKNKDCDYKTGGYVVVATFDFVDEDLYDFSYKLFNQWGIGDKNNNNGLLLVLDIGNDNYCYIIGTGLEKVLSDSKAKSIIDNYMEKYFALKDYNNAVIKTSEQFIKVIENGNFTVDDSQNNSTFFGMEIKEMIIIGAVLLIIFIAVIASLLTPRRRYRSRPRPRRFRRPPPPPRYGPRFGGPMPRRPRSRPMSSGPRFRGSGGMRSGGFGGSSRGTHHSGGSSRGAGGTRK